MMLKVLRFDGYAALGLAAVSLLACQANVDSALGYQSCTSETECEPGWYCVQGACRQLCTAHNDCEKAEACESGVCVTVPDFDCDEDADCAAPSRCESIFGAQCYAGLCHYVPMEEGTSCDDGNGCTSNDQCDGAGACTGDTLVCDEPPADLCLQDHSTFRQYRSTGACNPAQGACEYEYEDVACADCERACLGPLTPDNLTATPGDKEVTLTWDPVDGALAYNLYVSETAGGTAGAEPVPVSGATTLRLLAELSNGTTYYFAVSAVGGAGEGTLSSEVSAEPRISTPAQVSAESGDRQVTLTWGSVLGASSYNVYWGVQATAIENTVSDVTSPVVHTDRDNGTTYYYAVSAVDGPSESLLSEAVSALPRISSPEQVSAGGALQQVTVTWDPVPGAESYVIYWALQPGVTESSNQLDDAISPFVHAGLYGYTPYYYAVAAVDAASTSLLSAEVSATTDLDGGEVLVAPDAGANDRFGGALAVSGDYAIVGASMSDGGPTRTDAGGAYVFQRTGGSTWDTGTRLVPSDSQAYDRLGASVAIDGDYAIIGAIYEDGGDNDPENHAGAAYVFRRTGENSWDAGAKLAAPDAQADDLFGISAAISGDYAIVGTHLEDGGVGDPVPNAGAVYVFQRTDVNTWNAGVKLVAPDAQQEDWFGVSVAFSGDLAVVGAIYEDGGEGDPVRNAGAAYVFQHTAADTWDAGTKLMAPDAQESGFFGGSVAISGDYVLVGAGADDGALDPASLAGAAYVFQRTGEDTWDAGTKLVAPDAQQYDYFGERVALSGDYALVGARGEDGGAGDPVSRSGAAYLFHRIGPNVWDSGVRLAVGDPQVDGYFGGGVALNPGVAIVGAYLQDSGDGPVADAGAAYVFGY